MGKTYTIPEVKQRLAKHIQDVIVRVADDIQDLTKREYVKNGLMKADLLGAAHFEPGAHEPAEVGTPEHMEPGAHEQFAIAPPSGPETNAPISGGNGVPGGQLNQDTCPLCHQLDKPGSCTCLNGGMVKSEMCKSCGTSHTDACKTMEKTDLPPEKGGKKIKNGDDNKPKANALGKGAVPEAKPPSGKVPGGTGQAPMASNTSKPGITKEEMPTTMEKGALNPQMKQHAMVDASKAAAGAAAPAGMAGAMKAPPAAGLTNPNDMSRANAHADAMSGAFQPKGPINSGLELASPKKPGLMAPPAGARAPGIGAKPPMGGGMPKPSPFGKSEKCPFCKGAEHPGDCSGK